MELKNFFAQDDQGNLLGGATCYLYVRGTENLATGLQAANGNDLANPFTADATGLIQFAAPNGLYDLRVVKGARDYRVRVQCLDVTEQVAAAEDAADQAAADKVEIRNRYYGPLAADPVTRPDGSPMQEGDEYHNTATKKRRVFDGVSWGEFFGASSADFANSTDPAKGASMVGAFNSDLRSLLLGLAVNSLLASSAAGSTTVMRRRTPGATRHHIEPNGQVYSGTVSKLDLMHDPLDGEDGDAANYRILNFYTMKGATEPQGGASIINTKAVGEYFGFVPPMRFAINDYAYAPLSIFFFSGKSDNQWYMPYQGMWKPGRSISEGDHITAGFRLYVASSSGITGEAKPVHVSGTSSDGGVDWVFVRDYSMESAYFHPLVMIGNKADNPKFGHWDARAQLSRPMVLWNGTGKLRFLKADTTTGWEVFQTAGGDTLEFNNGAGKKMTLNSTTGEIALTGMTISGPKASVSDPGASWNVSGLEKVSLAVTAPLTITNLTNASGWQELKIIAGSAGVTLKHGTGITGGVIKLKGGADRTLAQYEGITLMANSSGGFFTEI